MKEHITVTKADHVATVTLNDPESGNALTGSFCEELARVCLGIPREPVLQPRVAEADEAPYE